MCVRVCVFSPALLQIDQFELSADEQTAAQAAIAADIQNEAASNADADADLKAEADETQVCNLIRAANQSMLIRRNQMKKAWQNLFANANSSKCDSSIVFPSC
jgi:hypothetical protein